MAKKVIQSEGSAAIGPYSPGAGGEGLFFLSGKAALDGNGKVIAAGDVAAQTEATIQSIEAVLADAGGTLDDVVKTTVFLSDMRHFEAMNKVYGRMFPNDPPARSTILMVPPAVDLLVEIDAIAMIGD
jgi:2-iminobutanoate/2-iminopropanoate deaminase